MRTLHMRGVILGLLVAGALSSDPAFAARPTSFSAFPWVPGPPSLLLLHAAGAPAPRGLQCRSAGGRPRGAVAV